MITLPKPKFSETNVPIGKSNDEYRDDIINKQTHVLNDAIDRVSFREIITDLNLNSRGPFVLLKDMLVLNAKERSDNDKGNCWNSSLRCEILSVFTSYQYFENPTLLSVIYLSKTRGRLAILRDIYNLKTFITYEMS